MILAHILSSMTFAFIHSWGELVIVLFTTSRDVFSLPRRIRDCISENLDPTMAAVAVVLVAITLALRLAEQSLKRRAT